MRTTVLSPAEQAKLRGMLHRWDKDLKALTTILEIPEDFNGPNSGPDEEVARNLGSAIAELELALAKTRERRLIRS